MHKGAPLAARAEELHEARVEGKLDWPKEESEGEKPWDKEEAAWIRGAVLRLGTTLEPGLRRAAGELLVSSSLSASTGLKGLKHRQLAKRQQDTQGVEEAAQLQPEQQAF